MKTDKTNEDNGTFPTGKSHPKTKPNGRPSIRSAEVEEALLTAIRQGKSLLEACEDPELPCRDTVFAWMAEDEARRAAGEVEVGTVLFVDLYSVAAKLRCDLLAEEILTIADGAKTGEQAQVAKLRIDARRWYISKVSPKKYGDKAGAEVTVNNAINNVTISEAQKLEIQEARRLALQGMRGKELN